MNKFIPKSFHCSAYPSIFDEKNNFRFKNKFPLKSVIKKNTPTPINLAFHNISPTTKKNIILMLSFNKYCPLFFCLLNILFGRRLNSTLSLSSNLSKNWKLLKAVNLLKESRNFKICTSRINLQDKLLSCHAKAS